MTSRDPKGVRGSIWSAILATAWLSCYESNTWRPAIIILQRRISWLLY